MIMTKVAMIPLAYSWSELEAHALDHIIRPCRQSLVDSVFVKSLQANMVAALGASPSFMMRFSWDGICGLF